VERRVIGRAGVEVGAIGLGCMPFTWAYGSMEAREEADTDAVIHRAVELGMTLIDTADVYGPFTNEQLVGRALAGRRDEVVLATKCGLVVDADRGMVRRGRPDYVRQACDDSLRRLRTDRIDLYQLHRIDPGVPIEETWGALAELVASGKVRALGLSEVTVDELRRAQQIFPVTSVQSELSLWTRDPIESGVLAWCQENSAGFLSFSPLGRGFLTGTLTPGSFDPGDFRARNPRFTEAAMRANAAIVDVVREIAERHGATPGQVALAWVLAQGESVVPIPGTTKLHHLEDNAAAADLRLTREDLAELDRLPQPVGSRY
jgi:aryl-alcohol dehydrogenase-like predicted oxidoreductase